MSLPVEQQQLQSPPPPVAYGQPYAPHTGGGSIGPVIGVLAVIAVLGVIAGIVGRLCSGRRIFGYGHYDCEGWMERRCGSCIDGRIEPPAPAPRPRANGGSSLASPSATPQEPNSKQPERPPLNPPETASS